MPKLKDRNRVLVTLKDKSEKIIERRIVNMSLLLVSRKLGIKSNLDNGDRIIIESEEI